MVLTGAPRPILGLLPRLMPKDLPFPIPHRLPKKIAPCPIVEAALEIRFVPDRPWEHFPGLFAEKFGAKYPIEQDTGVSNIPQLIRQQDPRFAFLPFRRLVGEKFSIQAGPNTVGLVTKQNAYPGWEEFWPAMAEIITGLGELKIMRETVRIGLRYINFFPFDIFDQLALSLNIGNAVLKNPETGLNTVFLHGQYRHFVQINNSSIIAGQDGKVPLGSILDIDTSINSDIPDIFDTGAALFRDAHQAEKSVFFGLLKPEYVATLNPEY